VRGTSPSRTSDWVAALRGLYSGLPEGLAVLDDPFARALVPSRYALLLRALDANGGGLAAHHALGALTRGLSFGVPLRTAAIDASIARSASEGTRQLVVLGAGLDARAYRMAELGPVTLFELDHPSTQREKVARTRSLAPTAREVRHVPIDFEREALGDVLDRAGHDRGAPTHWVWEGVTMYLRPDAIRATLDTVGARSAPGSRLAVTYLPPGFASAWERLVCELGARAVGEALYGLLSPSELTGELARHGFTTETDDDATTWAARWPARHARRVRPFERLRVAGKPR
jgi:methyltransferase (TIGR00027 family)